ncbi:SH3-domain-containing protein [Gyrodon lividus]|nr:SH3-domain-containing protein [Gyrodon lividus]
MVFTKLSVHEKEAFFGLLDEYFQSRPELFGNGNGEGGSSTGVISTGAAASAVHRALAANPEATSKIVSAGVTHGAARSNNPYAATMANNAELSNAVGRVAAASLAFSGGGGGAPKTEPPSLPRRTSNPPFSTNSSLERVASPGAEKPPTTPVASIPSAFSSPRNNFGPPPVRRVTSEASSGIAPPAPTFPRRQLAPEPEPEEPQGEWADVLYDYSSEDPGDLAIEAGSRVWVTAKSSDDWWTGQIEGRGGEGLFPASYVKLL